MGCKFYHPDVLYNQSLSVGVQPAYTFSTKKFTSIELRDFMYRYFAIADAYTIITGYELINPPNRLDIDSHGTIYGYLNHYHNQPWAEPWRTKNTKLFLSGANNFHNGRPRYMVNMPFTVRVHWTEIEGTPDVEIKPCINIDKRVVGFTDQIVHLGLVKLQDIDNWILKRKLLDQDWNKITPVTTGTPVESISVMEIKDNHFPASSIRALQDISPLLFGGEDIDPGVPYNEAIAEAQRIKPIKPPEKPKPDPLIDMTKEEKKDYLLSLHPDLQEAIKYAMKMGASGMSIKEREIINNLLHSDGCISTTDKIKNSFGLAVRPGCCKSPEEPKGDK